MSMKSSRRQRCGSILLLCLSIVATLSVLVFGFVRVAQLHQESHAELTKMMVAREAARMGVSHAIEQIIRDYNTEPFTRMDGPARAPFLPHDMPYLTMLQGNMPTNYRWDATKLRFTGNDLDDVPTARLLNSPLFFEWDFGDYFGTNAFFNWGDSSGNNAPTGGMSNTDGRGAYIEPNWHNRFNGPTVAATAVTPNLPSKVRFGSTAAAPEPARNSQIFYDEQWRRITGDPRTARTNARYRLRYAVSVTDLDGELLINPDPAMNYHDYKWTDPAAYATAAQARVVRAQHAIPPMITALNYLGSAGIYNCGVTGGAKVEHVFIGRGFTGNFYQQVGNDTPKFWPLMWRNSNATLEPNSNTPMNYFQFFLNGRINGWSTVLYPGGEQRQDAATRLFTMLGVPSSAAGCQDIPMPVRTSQYDPVPLYKSLVGPQYSFFNADKAIYSNNYNEDWNGNWARDGESRTLGVMTPFGRGLAVDGGTRTRFSGPVDTPWAVNVLTAPVQVVSGMVLGYMPPGAVVSYCGNRTTGTDVWTESRNQRDLFVKQINSTFPFDAPSGEGLIPNYHIEHTVTGDAGYRTPPNRYPGEMGFNGTDSTGIFVNDTLGAYLRTATVGGVQLKPVLKTVPAGPDGNNNTNFDASFASGEGSGASGAFDPYSATAFMKTVSGFDNNNSDNAANPAPFQPVGAPARNGFNGYNGPWAVRTNTNHGFNLNHPDSIWRSIAQAMGAAVAVARAQQMSIPTAAADPSTMFDGGPWSGPKVQTIDDLDALFLANLGIDITNPANPPTQAWTGRFDNGGSTTGVKVTFVSFTPEWNLAKLNGQAFFDDVGAMHATDRPHAPYFSVERTAAAERIINDFRLSFFGANPAYTEFAALDLNGDGKVNCSSVPSSVSATARERDLGIDQFVPGGIALARTTPSFAYFSHTGCFTITKSHFWRIMSRGEVWDNVFNVVVGQSELDSVVCVDPVDKAHEMTSLPKDPAGGQYSTHVIYQRFVHDINRASMSSKR